MNRVLRIGVTLGLLAALTAGTGTVAARSVNGKVFDAKFVGLPVKGMVLAGVTGAGHAWSIESGKAMIFANDRVKVIVEGLVLSPEGTQPAPMGAVVVSCNGGVGGVASGNIVQSANVPLSQPDGDAEFDGTLPLPSPCLDPVVFFTSTAGTWFAEAG
jgi:hypothetical protein